MISRLYRSTDRSECVAAFTSNSPHYFLPEELIQFERYLDHLPGPYFVVLDGTELVACGGYATGRVAGEADICWTIVHADHQGQGIGNFLLSECVGELLALDGLQTARLETSQHRIRFFQHWGFRVVDTTPNGFGPGLDRVEMRVVLDDKGRQHWHEMITGGLAAPDVEQPIPAIESYKEWTANRYNPGHYLGGRLEPHIDQLRTGPRGKRVTGLLLGVSALFTTVAAFITAYEFGSAEIIGVLVIAAVQWIAAIRMFKKGAASDADIR
jgi:ribosomal protein S18 acetylase RimI-like enzyme